MLRGRFKEPLHPFVAEYISSTQADAVLAEHDVRGSLAHVTMLERKRLVTAAEAKRLRRGLRSILGRIRRGKFRLKPALEDVHMNVEAALRREIGETALKLHTARSRNDQVALDLRLYVLGQIDAVVAELRELDNVLGRRVRETASLPVPGYTHLQRAQPLSVGHVLNAFAQMFRRDAERFADSRRRGAVSPLGAGALAGSSLPVEPAIPAAELGLEKIFANSLDAVSDRDFVAEFVFACALTATHLSQVAETLILWLTSEFGFARLPDSLATGSSLMPQKKNPDALEIVRAKSGTIAGELMNLLVVLKGLPIGYNRDLQETKPPAIRAARETRNALRVIRLSFQEITFDRDALHRACSDPNLYATDLVEHLVRKGVPFREAHSIVASLVRRAESRGIPLTHLLREDPRAFSSRLGPDVLRVFDPVASISRKTSPGAPGDLNRKMQ